jgi:hypothetical protein
LKRAIGITFISKIENIKIADNPELLQKTVGILFIATPHRGTPIASQYGRPFLRPTEDVVFLKTGNQSNRQLEAQFAASSKRIPLIWTILECKETPFSVKFRQREMVSQFSFDFLGKSYKIMLLYWNRIFPF